MDGIKVKINISVDSMIILDANWIIEHETSMQ